MTLTECDEHIGARVAMELSGRPGTLVSTGTWAAYVRFDGEDEPSTVAPRNISLSDPESETSHAGQR